MPKTLELIDSKSRLITAIAALFAGFAAAAGAVISAMPAEAQLSPAQSEKLTAIDKKVDYIVVLAQENKDRLDARSSFMNCTTRTIDQLVDKTGVKTRCMLEMAQ